MVGYNESSEHQLPKFWQGVAGVCSGVFTRLITQPLDVLKIRFQLQHEPLKRSAENYYWGIIQATSRIAKEEGFRSLWKGHVPAQVLSGVYGFSQFLSFEALTRIVSKSTDDKFNKTLVHFTCGSISGGIATTVSMPFDTVRTRLVGQGEPKIYRGVIHAFISMIRNEGFLSLYKGLSPNLFQIVPHTGLQFAFFNITTKLYSEIFNANTEVWKKLPVTANLVCGGAAGFLAKTVVYPLDLTKKRLQIQGFETARKRFGKIRSYSGAIDCIRTTFKEEGIRGMYKGFAASSVKAVVTSGLIFASYEEISHLLTVLKL